MRLPYGFVTRDRLLHLIDRPFLAPVTLIVAPTGYGKSVLTMHWATGTAIPVVWIQIGSRHNSLAVLLDDFLGGLSGVLGRTVRQAGPAGSAAGWHGVVLDAYHTEIADGTPLCIILDDYHLVNNRDVHEAITLLLQNLPPNLHLMIASRQTPPLPLGRLRAQGRVREITSSDLAFDHRETLHYLAGREDFIVSEAMATDLTSMTEGWIAAIQLASLAAGRTGLAPHRLLTADPARSEYLDDYIEQEVLQPLAPDLREFVFDTSFLPALDPAMCDAALGIETSGQFIAQLSRQRIFLVPDGQQRGMYRYHHLFAASTQRLAARLLPRTRITAIRGRLASWFLAQGDREQALEHLIATDDWECATPILVSVCRELADADLYHSILHWLWQVPDVVRTDQLDLAYWYTFSLLVLGHQREGRVMLEVMTPRWQASARALDRGRAKACRGMLLSNEADEEGMANAIAGSLELFPATAWVERLHALQGIMEVEFSRGHDDAARAAFATAQQVRSHLPPDQRWWNLHTQFEPANHLSLRGNLPAARAIYRHKLKELGGYQTHLLDKIRFRLTDLAIAQGDRAEVEAQLAQTEHEEPLIRHYWFIEALMTRSRAARLQGDLDQAEALLIEAIHNADQDGLTNEEVRARASLASLWVEQGNLAPARLWAEGPVPSSQHWARVFGVANHRIVLSEVLLAIGQPTKALAVIARLIEDGTRRKRWAELVQLHVYEAIALASTNRLPAARLALGKAVGLGREGRFIQPFLVPFHDLSPLLDSLAPASTDVPYVAEVVQAVRQRYGGDDTSLLSKRELDILALVKLGMPNREIAQRLFISEPTVKRHLANVNAKLGTRNRSEACAHASSLGLI